MALELACLGSRPAACVSQDTLLNYLSLSFLFCKMEIVEVFPFRDLGGMTYVWKHLMHCLGTS